MPLVRTRVHRYAVGTESLAIHGHTCHIGHVFTPGIAQGGYLVDIYT